MCSSESSVWRRSANSGLLALITASAAVAAGCLADAGDETDQAFGQDEAAVTTEDGLAEAYGIFKQQFTGSSQDRFFRIGFGYHPGLNTRRVTAGDVVANGTATLDFAGKRVTATLRGVPDNQAFDLWFVKNVGGDGKTVKPESTDQLFKVGAFTGSTGNVKTLDAAVGANIDFDLDLIVVTTGGKAPNKSVVAVGARTLFEKRFFRERAGGGLDPVTGPRSNAVESNDPLVQRGAKLFFEETFGGNGRNCGTCHRAENNLTIDAAFIATLPPTDPLFVAETNPDLAELEDPTLMRNFGLIRENADGLDAPTTKFVMRSTPHSLAMSTSIGTGDAPATPADGTPPDQRTGWSGDGAPGRGTLNEFAFGAVVQHFTRTLARRPGVDFRIPTQEELDALEAFQLFSGRQKNPQTLSITFADADAETGKNLFQGQGACVSCHRDLVAGRENFLLDTNVEALSTALGLPRDGGFGGAGTADKGFGVGRFNVPPLVEAADTAPFFHNGAVATIEDAVAFYTGPAFAAAPARNFSGVPNLDAAQVGQVGAFLRVINALENIRQVRKRVQFVQDNRSSGNTEILNIALEDCSDAIDDLAARTINPKAIEALRTARQTIEIGRANPDDLRPAFMTIALQWLGIAKGRLIVQNPLNEF